MHKGRDMYPPVEINISIFLLFNKMKDFTIRLSSKKNCIGNKKKFLDIFGTFIISKLYLNTLNLIKDRRQFLDIIKHLNESWTELIFIEPTKCDKFVLRKVEILTF